MTHHPSRTKNERHTMRRALTTTATLLFGSVLLLGACGSSTGNATSSPVSATNTNTPTTAAVFPTGSAPADSISFRPVLVAPPGSSGLGAGLELPTLDQLGPTALDGNGIVRATASLDPSTDGGSVMPLLAARAAGIDAFDTIATACAARTAVCPTGQLALVIDGTIVAAPTIMTPSFQADQIVIGGNWDLAQAEDIARKISAGSHA
jgi:hypothetical protein